MPSVLRKTHVRIEIGVLLRRLGQDLGVDSISIRYCIKRFRNEGLVFLTKTLPQISKSLLRSLELGYFDRTGLTAFRFKGRALCVLQSYLFRIFDQQGRLREDACPKAILAVRQFTEYFYKLSLSFTEADVEKAEAGFVKVEEEISRFVDSEEWVTSLRKAAFHLYPTLMNAQVHHVFQNSRPRFGPGSFFESKSMKDWHVWKQLPSERIGLCADNMKAFSGYFKAYPSSKEKVSLIKSGERQAEVMFVPKDARGPRVIARSQLHSVAPTMAFFDWASSTLERESCNRVNFESQQINRDLARLGSITGDTCTLDLKEASDRVRKKLALAIARYSPALRWFLHETSDTHFVLPSGRKISSSKVGGMGSGLTFPWMAFLAHLVVTTRISQQHRLPLKQVARTVYVYGDDIILPSKWYECAIEALTSVGLMVNTQKSFVRGQFRESCGGDYFKGCEVAPVRLRLTNAGLGEPGEYQACRKGTSTYLLIDREGGILQIERHCRELVKAGLSWTAEFLYGALEKHLKEAYPKITIPLPSVSGESPVLGRYSLTEVREGFSTVVLIPSSKKDVRFSACPYKHLSRVFKSRDGMDGIRFGEIPKPRSVKLMSREVASHVRSGVNQSDYELYQKAPGWNLAPFRAPAMHFIAAFWERWMPTLIDGV